MSKKKPDPTHVEKASKSAQITDLVRLAQVFSRASAGRSFTVNMPLFTAVKVEKGYRKHNIPIGTVVKTEAIYIGKKQGLIFQLRPVEEMMRQGDKVELIEVNWSDMETTMPDLIDALDDYCETYAEDLVRPLDEKVKTLIEKKPGMHAVLSEGFEIAQERARQQATQIEVENAEDFGVWS